LLTNSIATFVRHASTGRVASSRVSGAIYFDLKSPDLQQVLEKIASSHDIAATLDSFNPHQPQYKELKGALAHAREMQDTDAVVPVTKTKIAPAHQRGRSEFKVAATRIDAILANMERWRWLPRELGTAYAMVNIPDYTLTVMNGGKATWSTRIVVGQPGKHATPLLAETMKVHHVQSDVECAAFHYPKRISSGPRARSNRAGANRSSSWAQQRWLDPNISTTGRA
jgi:L,D-transpeptidase YcbB